MSWAPPPGRREQSPASERHERRAVAMAGFAVLENGETVPITVLDLSYEGCGVESPAPLTVGETIKLSVLNRGAIDAEIRWTAGGKAGLRFRAEEDQDDGKASERRRRQGERVALSAEVTMRRLGRAKYLVRVQDLSLDGCRVELAERAETGDHVLVKFIGLDVLEASVCWVRDQLAGLSFARRCSTC